MPIKDLIDLLKDLEVFAKNFSALFQNAPGLLKPFTNADIVENTKAVFTIKK
ncbi:hypothetical protein M5J20_08505 [Corynebacterium sp. TA-R-1]|uniref:Uncharacterized protein n=1 Tax=Corynebacterium stercoris TaxID=2943490 RepID=A0ABT1G335_9CORY|nr:hypothetical protein [Corynebacterium stercoris]MCP1388222.1 hypothetical protein [Corynebacterium stercoris]